MPGIQIRWLGFACFEIVLPSKKSILTDPYLDDSFSAPIKAKDIERADYIFITHGHFDHVLDVGKIVARCQSMIYCTQEVANALEIHLQVPSSRLQPVAPGEKLVFEDLEVLVVKGMHPELSVLFEHITGRKPEPALSAEQIAVEMMEAFPDRGLPDDISDLMRKFPGGEQLNFIFQTLGNLRIYDFGSYPHKDLLPIAGESRAQIILLQVVPGFEVEAAEIVFHANSSLVIPQHHEGLFPGSPKANLDLIKKRLSERSYIKFTELSPGKWYEIRLDIN